MGEILQTRMHDELGLPPIVAQRIIDTIGALLGAALSAAQARLLGERVPSLRSGLSRPARLPRGGLREWTIAAVVARKAGLQAGRAVEALQVVCRTVGELVDDEVLGHLRATLPAATAALFEPRPFTDEPGPFIHPRRRGQTLASGRPGGTHPISESAPGHAESVARSSEPHAGTKLSTSHGVETETIATGRPGSHRPVSEGDG